jgi:adenylosuccinate synthase
MSQEIVMTIGLGFGDESKGSTVDFLARHWSAKLVILFNGGPQRAHNGVTEKNIHHCHAQFSSGTFFGAETYHSRFVSVNPLSLMEEAEILAPKIKRDPFEKLAIDPRCPIITPFHIILNQMSEIMKGEDRNGSCGMGVGEAVKDTRILGDQMIFANDLLDEKRLKYKLDFIWRMKIDLAEQLVMDVKSSMELRRYLTKLNNRSYFNNVVAAYAVFAKKYGRCIKELSLNQNKSVIFEGSQGVLLHENYGFYPHITHSKTGFENADAIVAESGFKGKVTKMGILRAYATRHGAGPFVTENIRLTRRIPDMHNWYGDWQGQFRVGWFDLVASRYALSVAGNVDSLAITNLDRLGGMEKIKVCTAYEYFGPKNKELKNLCKLKWGSTITAIKNNGPIEKSTGLTEIMKYCRPSEWLEFEGWGSEIRKAKKLEDVPKTAREYLDFLSSNQGLRREISLISVGPTWKNKIPVGS